MQIKCKDCKHRGVGNNDFPADIQWPDNSKCPFQISDPYYSWIPDDDWYCANAEIKDGYAQPDDPDPDPCSECQEFSCYYCEYKQVKKR